MCAIIKNPLQRDGTNQEERLLKALLPDNAKIDDRSIEEIISFATKYTKLIAYYNTKNVHEGDWSCFYENDSCIQLALLSTIDTDSLEAKLQAIATKVEQNLSGEYCGPYEDGNEDPLPQYFDDLINLIYSLAIRIQQACCKLPEGHALKEEIIAIIKTDIRLAIIDNQQQDALIKLIGYDKASIAPVNNYTSFIVTSSRGSCGQAWELDQEGYDCIYPDNSFNFESLKSLFYIFFIALLQIKSKAKSYFEECIQTDNSHPSHITLFLTFLYLFQHALDHLNSLTETHLLHYYEKVLCLHKKKETPDKVHVIFELAKNFDTYLIEEGVQLNGGKDKAGKLRVYKLLEEVVVNKAQVAELKTTYISGKVVQVVDPVSGLTTDKKVSTVQAASVANSKDGLGLAFAKDETAHWRALGSDKSPTTEIGFALASPMFMLTEGVREIRITFDLEVPANFPELIAPFLRTSIFRIQYSSGDKWVETKDVSSTLMTLANNDLALYNNCFEIVSDAAIPGSSVLPANNPSFEKKFRAKKIKFANDDDPDNSKFQEDAEGAEKTFYFKLDVVDNKLSFLIHINEFANPITAVDLQKNTSPIATPWPVFKFLIRNEDITAYSAFTIFKDVKLKKADIKSNIKSVKNLAIQNDTAILNASREFSPFGINPTIGSSFYIGSNEAFQKKLDRLDINLEWANLPLELGTATDTDKFSLYYSNYTFINEVNTQVTNAYFTFSIDYLYNRTYQNLKTAEKLFTDDTLLPADQKKKVTLNNLTNFPRFPNLDPPLEEFKVDSQRGFIRLKLEKGFLHADYPPSLVAKTIEESKKAAPDPKLLPREPFTPILKSVWLDYASSESFDINMPIVAGVNTNTSYEALYHLPPFGYKKVAINATPTVQQPALLLPQYTIASAPIPLATAESDLTFTQGNLYVGLKDAKPEQKVNILFQVLEGSGDNSFAPPDIEWQYLINNDWFVFKPFEIQDHTRADESTKKSLLKSGIIEFSLPKTITSAGTTILNKELLWIRACAHQDNLPTVPDSNAYQSIQRVDALPELVAVIAQAGIAEFENNGNSLEHLAVPLPAKTISKFVDSKAAIKTLSQPFNSFDGRLSEDGIQFYTRISERLRHKNRAICIWDYERLVLQQFPSLHKVKCLNHTNILQNDEIAPGFVSIAVIPDLRNKNAVNLLEPRVAIGVLDDIKVFLKKRTNVFVASPYTDKLDYLEIVNPLYEQLKVKCCVRFYEGLDTAFYKYVLNTDLKNYLSPWAYDSNSEINFGSTVHKSSILNFIEEREYVDVVLGFKVEHFKDGLTLPDYDPDWIIPTTSRSILTSYNLIDIGKEYEHEIDALVYDEDNPCPECGITAAPMKLLTP